MNPPCPPLLVGGEQSVPDMYPVVAAGVPESFLPAEYPGLVLGSPVERRGVPDPADVEVGRLAQSLGAGDVLVRVDDPEQVARLAEREEPGPLLGLRQSSGELDLDLLHV